MSYVPYFVTIITKAGRVLGYGVYVGPLPGKLVKSFSVEEFGGGNVTMILAQKHCDDLNAKVA
jgi:hypothetical protein